MSQKPRVGWWWLRALGAAGWPLHLRPRGDLVHSLRQLLQHECPQCPDLPPFGLFGDLEQHMRRQHELFCCKLCLKHLKVGPDPRVPRARGGMAAPECMVAC